MTLIFWTLICWHPSSFAQEALVDSLEREIQDSLILRLPNRAQEAAEFSRLLSGILMACKIELRNDLDLSSCQRSLRFLDQLDRSADFASKDPFEKLLKKRKQKLSIDQYIERRKEESKIGTLHE